MKHNDVETSYNDVDLPREVTESIVTAIEQHVQSTRVKIALGCCHG